MSKHIFQIGDWVLVSRKVYFAMSPVAYRTLEKIFSGEIGQICGMCRRFSGQVESNTHTSEFDGTVSEGFLNVSASHLLFQVKLGMLNKPIEAEAVDLFWCDPLPKGLPMLYQPNAAQSWTAEARASASKEAQTWERNEKGQWT